MTKDYTIPMADSTGRVCNVFINGTTIDELVATGMTFNEAADAVEENSVEVAIRQGELGPDCWLTANK